MFALDRAERSALAAGGVAALLAAFAVAPSRAGNAALRNAPPAIVGSAVHRLPADVAVIRDPFGPESDLATATPASSPLPRLGPLPANAGAGPFPFGAAPSGPRVLAVVNGPLPRALVDDSGRTRVVGAGDRFAGARIVTIEPDGIVLDDGRHVSTDTEHRP